MPRKKISSVEHFHAYLKAADRVALEVLIRGGLLSDTYANRDYYYCALEALAREFGEPYQATGLDDLVSHQELHAREEAAHMVGLALGLRLQQANIGALAEGTR